ncbi:hypothetical protein HK104_002707 [Borealophlyctis nickersoniae]|nr:hypothetical protein HK104_002707 [Borealophlyctis nickersoniae]
MAREKYQRDASAAEAGEGKIIEAYAGGGVPAGMGNAGGYGAAPGASTQEKYIHALEEQLDIIRGVAEHDRLIQERDAEIICLEREVVAPLRAESFWLRQQRTELFCLRQQCAENFWLRQQLQAAQAQLQQQQQVQPHQPKHGIQHPQQQRRTLAAAEESGERTEGTETHCTEEQVGSEGGRLGKPWKVNYLIKRKQTAGSLPIAERAQPEAASTTQEAKAPDRISQTPQETSAQPTREEATTFECRGPPFLQPNGVYQPGRLINGVDPRVAAIAKQYNLLFVTANILIVTARPGASRQSNRSRFADIRREIGKLIAEGVDIVWEPEEQGLRMARQAEVIDADIDLLGTVVAERMYRPVGLQALWLRPVAKAYGRTYGMDVVMREIE